MNGIINNFYFMRILFIVMLVLISVFVVDTMKKKYSLKLNTRFNFKNIDFKFLLRMIFLSFALTVFIEQIIYFLPIKETISNVTFSFGTILVEILITCLFAPVFEEIIFRFGLYEYLNRKIKSNGIALLLTSIIFSLMHFYGIDGFIILLIISLIWNYSYFKTNNMIYPIIIHFVYNVYAMLGYIELDNIIYILFGVICLIMFILLKIKSSSKNTTAKN